MIAEVIDFKTENPAKIVPLDYKVLIKMDPAEKKSKGGIIIPDQIAEKEAMAHDKATVVDVGSKAFSDFGAKVPRVGDRVICTKYAGNIVKGADGEEYRLCNDKEIIALIY